MIKDYFQAALCGLLATLTGTIAPHQRQAARRSRGKGRGAPSVNFMKGANRSKYKPHIGAKQRAKWAAVNVTQ